MMANADLHLVLVVSTLIGAWLIIRPDQVLFLIKLKWYFRVNPFLEDMDDNPILQSLARVIGIVIIGVAILMAIFLEFGRLP